jgi:hypothetical protein
MWVERIEMLWRRWKARRISFDTKHRLFYGIIQAKEMVASTRRRNIHCIIQLKKKKEG